MNYRDTIRDMLTDKDGNYKLGLTNGIRPEDVLLAMKEDPTDKDLYRTCSTEINAVCVQICKEGYFAGGVSRAPTVYFIAKCPSEQRMLVNSKARNNIGRLQLLQLRGKGVINTRQIKGAENALLRMIEECDEQEELNFLDD